MKRARCSRWLAELRWILRCSAMAAFLGKGARLQGMLHKPRANARLYHGCAVQAWRTRGRLTRIWRRKQEKKPAAGWVAGLKVVRAVRGPARCQCLCFKRAGDPIFMALPLGAAVR